MCSRAGAFNQRADWCLSFAHSLNAMADQGYPKIFEYTKRSLAEERKASQLVEVSEPVRWSPRRSGNQTQIKHVTAIH